MQNTNNKITLLNKVILFSGSLLVIFLFGIFIGARIKQFNKPLNVNNISASSPKKIKVNIPYKVIKEVRKVEVK